MDHEETKKTVFLENHTFSAVSSAAAALQHFSHLHCWRFTVADALEPLAALMTILGMKLKSKSFRATLSRSNHLL